MTRLLGLGALSITAVFLARAAHAADAAPASASKLATTPAPLATATPPSPDRGRFGALWVTPIATHHFQGAGMEAGYRYSWLAGVYRVGFLQNGYEPSAGGSLRRAQRFLLELELDGQIRFRNAITLALGAGGALMTDHVDTASPGAPGWNTTTSQRGRIRGLASAALVGPLFEIGVTTYLESSPEVRLSFGVCWGRHARR